MREDDERFLAIANQSASLLKASGLRSDHSILDIGSGYGRLAFGLLNEMDFTGRYEGFDLLPSHIEWCSAEIASHFPNFNFRHLDIANARYNPEGSLIASELRFPYEDNSFDYCALFSVFTHMYEPDIQRYMHEIKRVLKSPGTCVATFFLFNEERLPAVTSETSALPMRYQLSDVCRYFNTSNILHAISYDESHIRGLWASAGFAVTDLKWGSWAGDQPVSSDPNQLDVYQDVVTVRT